MATTITRKQRLLTLEKEIRSGMEEFYYTGQKLKEIRDDELYREDRFDTWERYCRERWEWQPSYVHKLIVASEYREKLPPCPSGTGEWTERSVRELRRIPDKKQAARVAKKILQEVENNPDVKLSSTTVKRFVDEDLGVKKPKSKPKPKESGIDLRDDLPALRTEIRPAN